MPGVWHWESMNGKTSFATYASYCTCIQLRWKGCAPLFWNESLFTLLMQKIRIRPCSRYGLRVRIMPWPSLSHSSAALDGKERIGATYLPLIETPMSRVSWCEDHS